MMEAQARRRGAGRTRMTLATVVLLLTAGAVTPSTFAWNSAHHIQMVRDAAGFLPPVMRGVMRLYVKDIIRGLEDANQYADAIFRQPEPLSQTQVAETLDTEMRAVANMIRSHQPFAGVFYRYGRIVGPIAELNVPLHYPAGNPLFLDEVRSGFESLSDAAAPKFRILFSGYQDALMRGGPATPYLLESSKRAEALYPVLYEAFVVDGKVLPASSFDFRSIPFGVASISYSRSVNTIVNVWCAMWREAGGDMANRPY